MQPQCLRILTHVCRSLIENHAFLLFRVVRSINIREIFLACVRILASGLNALLKIRMALLLKRRISLEVIPPRNSSSIGKLIKILDPLSEYVKQFSITCHETSTCLRTGAPELSSTTTINSIATGFDRSLAMLRELRKTFPQKDIMFHLTCYNLNRENIDSKLLTLSDMNVRRLLVVSGEGFTRLAARLDDDGHFHNSLDVVKYINENHLGLFETVGVSGYPHGHPDSPNRLQDLNVIKQKVGHGANLIVTQCIFSFDEYLEFADTVADSGIVNVPIYPSILLYESLEGLKRFASMARVNPPRSLLDQLSVVGVNNFQDRALQNSLDLLKDLLESKENLEIHISPINRFEFALKVLKHLEECLRAN